jgi:hypothetical protein
VGEQGQQQEGEPPRSQTPESSAERSDGSRGAAPAGGRKARRVGAAGGKKRLKATVDDIDTLQIRGRVGGWVGGRATAGGFL